MLIINNKQTYNVMLLITLSEYSGSEPPNFHLKTLYRE